MNIHLRNFSNNNIIKNREPNEMENFVIPK